MSAYSTPKTLRGKLVSLVLAFMLPTLAAAIAIIAYVYTAEKHGFERGLAEATRALALVVDRELSKREGVIKTLAESPTLTDGDLRAFYAYAKAVAPTNDTTIVLSDLNGQQIINTRRALGESLPRTLTGEQRRAAGPLATVVSNLYFAPLGKQYSFAVEVPVVREGKILYYLSIGQFASHLQQVLIDQRLPTGWIGTVVDRKDVVVARNPEPQRFVNSRASDEVLGKLQRAAGEPVRIRALDGSAVLASYSRSPSYGWAVFVGVPEAQITSPLQAAGIFGVTAAFLLIASLFAAMRLGGQLVGPVTKLTEAALALGRGESVGSTETGMPETDVVAQALQNASRSVATARSDLEHRVKEALEDADRAHKSAIRGQRLEAVGQLTGGVAHDFNNLLMVVGTNVHLLRSKRSDLAGDVQLARIERAVSTGTKLTRQLLSFARRQPLRPQVIELARALPELMDLVHPSLGSNIVVDCVVDDGLPQVEMDPAELELALINLSLNARDAMPEGGRLTVRATMGRGDQALANRPETVVIEVRDTGTGIDPAIIDRVFEPFFTTKEMGRGTGLGLSQVYGFATEAGGTVQVSSTGAGTAVRLLLPGVTHARRPEDASFPGSVAAPLGSVVLLVEDNVELAQVTRELLAQEGCVVHYASNSSEALSQLAGLDPTPLVVLSDIRMPGEMDGLALAIHLRRIVPRLPVILMTGYTSDLDAARAAGLEVLSKPVQPSELLAVLARATSTSNQP